MSIEYRRGHSTHGGNATLRVMGRRWDAQESTCMWKLPDVEGRRGRCWELKGETKEEEKITGRRSANTDRKRRLGSLTGTGRAGEQERGGVSPHTERKPDFRSGSCKRETARGEGRHMLHGTIKRKNITDDAKERILKEFLACLVQFLHNKPSELGSEHRRKGGSRDFSITPNRGTSFNYNRG